MDSHIYQSVHPAQSYATLIRYPEDLAANDRPPGLPYCVQTGLLTWLAVLARLL